MERRGWEQAADRAVSAQAPYARTPLDLDGAVACLAVKPGDDVLVVDADGGVESAFAHLERRPSRLQVAAVADAASTEAILALVSAGYATVSGARVAGLMGLRAASRTARIDAYLRARPLLTDRERAWWDRRRALLGQGLYRRPSTRAAVSRATEPRCFDSASSAVIRAHLDRLCPSVCTLEAALSAPAQWDAIDLGHAMLRLDEPGRTELMARASKALRAGGRLAWVAPSPERTLPRGLRPRPFASELVAAREPRRRVFERAPH